MRYIAMEWVYKRVNVITIYGSDSKKSTLQGSLPYTRRGYVPFIKFV